MDQMITKPKKILVNPIWRNKLEKSTQFLKSTALLTKRRPMSLRQTTWSIQWGIMSLQVLMPSQGHVALATTKPSSRMTNTILVQPISPLSHANPTSSSTLRTQRCCTANKSVKSEKWHPWPKWWQQSRLSNLPKSSSSTYIRLTSRWASKLRKQLEPQPTLSRTKWSQSSISFTVWCFQVETTLAWPWPKTLGSTSTKRK